MSWKDRAKPVVVANSPVSSNPPVSAGGSWKDRARPIEKESMFKRFGGVLPVAGSVAGGLAGGTAGTVFGLGVGAAPGAIGGATLGGAAGEAGRQLLGRALGEKVPQTSTEAAKSIGIEGAMSAAGEATGLGIGRMAGKAYKAFPKVGHAFSGTPAVNLARAQKRGFGVYFPGMSREVAGEAQGKAENAIVDRMFSPKERVLLRSKDAGYADTLMKSVMLKQERGLPISPKEAIGLRIMAPVKRAADTMRGLSKNRELDNATRGARAVIANQFPVLSQRLGQTERSITASQLRKVLPVNKTNPDQISKLGTLLSVLSGSLALPFSSPLAMGVAGATMGQVKKSVPKMVRRGIQRTGIQSLERALAGEE